jgi:hypothetical protein
MWHPADADLRRPIGVPEGRFENVGAALDILAPKRGDVVQNRWRSSQSISILFIAGLGVAVDINTC